MANTPLTYDWDHHFEILEVLHDLDRIHRTLKSGKLALPPGQVFFGGIFNKAAKPVADITKKSVYDILEEQVQEIVALTNRHADFTAARAQTLVTYLQDAVDWCWDKNWEQSMRHEIHRGLDEIKALWDSLQAVKPVFSNKGQVYMGYNDVVWSRSLIAVEDAQERCRQMEERYRFSEDSPYRGAVESIVAARMRDAQTGIALRTFKHCETMVGLAGECLAVVATIQAMQNPYGGQALQNRKDDLSDVSLDLMMMAMLDMGRIATKLNRAALSRDMKQIPFAIAPR